MENFQDLLGANKDFAAGFKPTGLSGQARKGLAISRKRLRQHRQQLRPNAVAGAIAALLRSAGEVTAAIRDENAMRLEIALRRIISCDACSETVPRANSRRTMNSKLRRYCWLRRMCRNVSERHRGAPPLG